MSVCCLFSSRVKLGKLESFLAGAELLPSCFHGSGGLLASVWSEMRSLSRPTFICTRRVTLTSSDVSNNFTAAVSEKFWRTCGEPAENLWGTSAGSKQPDSAGCRSVSVPANWLRDWGRFHVDQSRCGPGPDSPARPQVWRFGAQLEPAAPSGLKPV